MALLFLFLPGYIFTLYLPKIKNFFERLAFSFVLSLSFEIIISSLVAFLKPTLINHSLTIIAAFTIVMAIIKKKKIFILLNEWKNISKKEKVFFGVVCFLSLGAAIFIFYPHFGYLWPIHVDEWWAIGTIKNLVEGKSLNLDPYSFTPYPNYKPGFTSLLAAFSSFFHIDPIKYWPFLPAFNVFLVSFIASLILFKITRNFFAAGLVPLFLVALRSNAYVLGWWFFVPSSFALIFVLFLLVAAKHLILESPLYIFLSLILFTALGLIYLPFLGFVLLSFIPFTFQFFKKFPKIFFLLLIGTIVLISVFFFKSPYEAYWLNEKPFMIKNFFVPIGATFHFFEFLSFFKVMPLIIGLLAILGAFAVRKNNDLVGLLTAGLISVLNLILIYWKKFSFLVFYQRSYYFGGVVLAILAAFGLDFIWPKLKLKSIFKLAIVIAVIIAIFDGYFNLPSGTLLYHLVNSSDLEAFRWLKNQNNLKGTMTFAEPAVGSIITPFTRLPTKFNWLTTQNITIINQPTSPLLFFQTDDCQLKQEIVKKLNVSIIYSHRPQDCQFLKEIYNSNGVFIYEATL